MERWLLCALVLLRPMDALDGARTQEPSVQARTTRGLPPLCLEGKGQQPQHLEGPAGQGTPCPSLTAGSLTTSVDWSHWSTDGSLETNDSDSNWGERARGRLVVQGDGLTVEYWSEVAIDFLIIISAILFLLICCCYLTLCWRPPHPDPSESERFPLRSTSSSLDGSRNYGAIMNAGAEGQDSTSAEDGDDEDDDCPPLLWTIDKDGEPVPSYRLKSMTEPKSVFDTAV